MRDGQSRIDLHVHTARYSYCAELVDPFLLAEQATRSGLAGVVLTEHDNIWNEKEIELLRAGSPEIKIYRGIEVTASTCHLVVIGMTQASVLHKGASVEEIVEQVALQRGAVILAHPFRDSDPALIPVHLVDAIEVASTSFSEDEAHMAIALAKRYAKPAVAASDAHALSRVGWAWTEFETLPADEQALAHAIRRGKGRPVIPSSFPS